MEIIFSEQFEQAYEKLTAGGKQSVRKGLNLLGNNPRHPGLHIKKMKGKKGIWEARPSKKLRMTFEMTGNTIVMRNVGEHDRVLKRP